MTTFPGDGSVTLLLCGDVMLGRGIDQVLGHPGDPTLTESYVKDARDYVSLAESLSGPIPRPVDDRWPWGDALADLDGPGAVRVLNLETSITRCNEVAPAKAVHYRMCPENVGSVLVARPDVCVLANNHVLDFGRRGLDETLAILGAAGQATAGAGRDQDEAGAPAVVRLPGKQRVVVLAWAHASSGVPHSWAAGPDRSGVALLPDLSEESAAVAGARVRAAKEAGAIVLVSLHWGSNWGYEVPPEQVRFAHRLVDAGADLVHGHSSHHPRPAEVRRGRLVLFGCGDFVNDYEGIGGHQRYRGELRVLYRVRLDRDGTLLGVELVPFLARRFRLERAGAADRAWLASTLDRYGRAHGTGVREEGDGRLSLLWRK